MKGKLLSNISDLICCVLGNLADFGGPARTQLTDVDVAARAQLTAGSDDAQVH